jgi:predicted acylesterase/phospholipase RssA
MHENQVRRAQGHDAGGRRRFLRLTAAGAMAAALPSCAVPMRGTAVPREKTTTATVLGLPNERYFPTSREGQAAIEREFQEAFERRRRALGLAPGDLPSVVDLLSVSGGGENGAFGAGLLCGWTAHGDRPDFLLVTGISTGALTAPFAFLGPNYDPQLRAVYTDLKASEVLEQRWLGAAVWDDAVADNAPLFRTISRYIDQALLSAIAREYDAGRMLLIASTNLDAQIPVVWNIGAIAKSGDPRAPELVRRILLASAAIPGAFPPAMIDVTVDGQRYQEMHVDGGAFAQAFLYPAIVTNARRERQRRGERVAPAKAYIIRNGRLDPDWASVDRRTMGIAGRAINTMIAASGMNDVIRMYGATQRDGVDYNLAFIGRDFTVELKEPFEQHYMRALFDYGYERARRGYDWEKRPPF